MSLTAVILAAGQGTRFRSRRAKVLHPAAGRSMLRWVLEAVRPLECERIVVVVGHQADEVRTELGSAGLQNLVTVEQAEQRGTGHALRVAAEAGALDAAETVLVLPGDAPLLRPEPLQALLAAQHGESASLATLLTTELANPTGYGRVLRDEAGSVSAIVEERDATPEERTVREVGVSIYAFQRVPLTAALARLRADNAQGEEYLTDTVALLRAEGRVGAVRAEPEDVTGVNDRAALSAAAAVLRGRLLNDVMLAGATVMDPGATWIEAGVRVEPDAVILPGVLLEGATRIGAGAVVGPHCRLVDTQVAEGAEVTFTVARGAVIGPGAQVGPFASLRPGTVLDAGAKAGTFVEMKNSHLGAGAKAPHLAYVGDATVGERANLGAGTITANYDGFTKSRTEVGARARVGSDTVLVAPVHVGEDAYTGAGSVISDDVPAGALAVERSQQRTVEGYAARKRARHERAQNPKG